MMRTFPIGLTCILVLGGCQTTPVDTPKGLAQWYPQGHRAPPAPETTATEPTPAQSGAFKMESRSSAIAPKAIAAEDHQSLKQRQPAGDSALQYAKLRNRLKDLEQKYDHLWLKYQALEKGLTLGLVPPEVDRSLNAALDRSTTQPALPPHRLSGAPPRDRGTGQNDPVQTPSGIKHRVKDMPIIKAVHEPMAPSLSEGIKDALALYQSAKYGKALLAFQGLQKQYSPKQLKGNDHYWIGLCWYQLKDFSKARESLDIFQDRYPGHNFARKAKLYQAKIDIDVGLTKKGVAALEELVRQQSNDQVAKLALSEIESVNDIFR